jgi:hypothetical protein
MSFQPQVTVPTQNNTRIEKRFHVSLDLISYIYCLLLFKISKELKYVFSVKPFIYHRCTDPI